MVRIMKKDLLVLTIALFFVSIGLSGCPTKTVETVGEADIPMAEAVPEPEPEPEPEPVFEPVPEPEPEPEAVPEAEVVELRDVFFDYDRYAIRDDAREVLSENARFLKKNSDARITIEGHCDERGTIEYNIALGERRARAVKKFLTDLGVDPARLSIVSYGKERPFCFEHNEQCWQENRRAHMVTKR
jgi:peptidoglycan-associated lipoprotein